MIPFGIFHSRPCQYHMAKELGFNLVHYNNNETDAETAFKGAGQLGLKIFADPRVLLSGGYKLNGVNPTLQFLYIADEPDLHGFNPGAIRRSSDYFKTMFHDLPTMVTISALWHKFLPWYKRAPFFNYLKYRDCTDLIGVDVYKKPSSVRNHLLLNVRPALVGKDWWGIVDIHRPVNELWPTVQAYLEAGAKGILCYAWIDEGWNWNLNDYPETQLEIKRISELLLNGD